MLDRGGSAVDAAIATNAALGVVYPHMAGLGGDLFCLIWDAHARQLHALNGSGRAARAATIESYAEKGHTRIPQRGPLSIVTVPGAVDAWRAMHQRFGKLPLSDALAPAIDLAEHGFAVSESLAAWAARDESELAAHPATSAAFRPQGRPLRHGQRLQLPHLAATLRTIAIRGPDALYRGDIAERLHRYLADIGAPLAGEDLASHRSDWVEPISIDYRGLRAYQLPPNTQGLTALQMLGMLRTFELAALGDRSAAYVHLMAEAARVAFLDRDRYCVDPAFTDLPISDLLSDAHISAQRATIDPSRKTDSVPGASMGGDTCYFCAVDRDGNAVSIIQSIYFDFGSAIVAGDTGVLLQNRGSFFSLDPAHPNSLGPGKRTFHTIIPAMLFRDGQPALLYGSMGGEGQPQTQAALATRIVDFRQDVQTAIEAPRWLYGRTWGAESSALRIEEPFGSEVAARLESMGHRVEVTTGWSDALGHAQAIQIDREQGVYWGGADPRGDGLAAGW